MSEIKTERTAPPENDDSEDICELEHLRKLFIGGLAPYTTEDSLKEFYGQFGKIVDVVVMRDPTSKRSRGFGFVTFTRSSMVDKAQDNRPHVIDGKTVEAKRALPRPEREARESSLSVKKLFVGGLKDNHDDKCLQEYFSQFGKVISVKILTDKTTGKRRGFAFVEFDDYDSVDKAILQKSHSIKYVLVDVKKSVYNQENRSGGNMNNQNDGNKQSYRNGPPNQQTPQMGHYGQQPPMNGGPPAVGPPANYNYWGPPPPQAMQGPAYNGYPQQPPMNNWNYPPAAQPWNAGPPPVQNSWYPPQQWGAPPPAGGVPPPVGPVAMNAVPSTAPNWAGPSQVAPVPPAQNVAPVPPVSSVAVPQQQTANQSQRPNFGTGYQQSYGGGPTKNNMHQSRVNPYHQSNANGYGGNNQAGQGYNGSSSNNVAITAGGGGSGGGNKFRR